MSPTADIPKYEDALAQLRKLKEHGVPESKKEAIEAVIFEKLSDNQTFNSLVDEVTELANGAVAIDKGFHDVYVALGNVDNGGYVDAEGKPLPKLQPTWKGFQETYAKLLLESRVTAWAMVDYLRDFNEVALPTIEKALDDPKNQGKFQDALAVLNMFIYRQDPNEGVVDGGDAGSHSRAFTDLRRNLEHFKNSFDGWTRKEKSGKVDGISRQIDDLSLNIKKCDDLAVGMGAALGITVFATASGAVGALAALGTLGPLYALTILTQGVRASVTEVSALTAYIDQGNGSRKKLKADQRQLTELEDKLTLLQSLQAGLEEQKSVINDIGARLDRFAAFWAMVSHDARLVRDMFKSASANSPTVTVLRRRIQLLMKTYAPLKAGLRLYAATIDSHKAAYAAEASEPVDV